MNVLPPVAPSATALTLVSPGEAAAPAVNDRVVVSLLFRGCVQPADIERALARPNGPPAQALWRRLADLPGLDREEIFGEAARTYAFEEARISRAAVAALIRQSRGEFSEAQWGQMRALGVLPLRREPTGRGDASRWTFGTFDPLNPDVERLLGTADLNAYQLQYLRESEVRALIAEAFPRQNEYLDRLRDEPYATDLDTGLAAFEPVDEQEIEAQIKQSALLALFEGMLVEAVRQGASDVHVRPDARGHIGIHFRIDGRLRTWHTEERVYPEAFLAVVKDNARGVDRFERDTAQDGFMQRPIDGALIRFRVSVLPMAGRDHGHRLESVVIRVLDDRKAPADLAALGLNEAALDLFEEAVAQPHGLVVVTGPTGSGKSTTLHAALRRVATPELNALTVEDPVEYLLPGIVQVKLSHKLDLEGALRAILRHDPDVVMVGEMRDRATAELAIKLANTGHLTFSTLHTNDAPSAVSRLYKMGIEPFLIAYAINLVVAQRLVRTLCPACKVPAARPDHRLLHRLGLSDADIASATFYEPARGADCGTCGGQGYRGRRAVAEVLPFTEDVRAHVAEAGARVDEGVLRGIAHAEGLPTLASAATALACTGATSIAEARRAVFLR